MRFELNESEVEFIAIRAQGAGGQNINKVSNAVHLRFDIAASSLPDESSSACWPCAISASAATALSSSRRKGIAAWSAIARMA